MITSLASPLPFCLSIFNFFLIFIAAPWEPTDLTRSQNSWTESRSSAEPPYPSPYFHCHRVIKFLFTHPLRVPLFRSPSSSSTPPPRDTLRSSEPLPSVHRQLRISLSFHIFFRLSADQPLSAAHLNLLLFLRPSPPLLRPPRPSLPLRRPLAAAADRCEFYTLFAPQFGHSSERPAVIINDPQRLWQPVPVSPGWCFLQPVGAASFFFFFFEAPVSRETEEREISADTLQVGSKVCTAPPRRRQTLNTKNA